MVNKTFRYICMEIFNVYFFRTMVFKDQRTKLMKNKILITATHFKEQVLLLSLNNMPII